jgi:hypothetical protein
MIVSDEGIVLLSLFSNIFAIYQKHQYTSDSVLWFYWVSHNELKNTGEGYEI